MVEVVVWHFPPEYKTGNLLPPRRSCRSGLIHRFDSVVDLRAQPSYHIVKSEQVAMVVALLAAYRVLFVQLVEQSGLAHVLGRLHFGHDVFVLFTP